jgi:SEC-C motif-containing protein
MAKIGRNEPCPCGSGRKAKRCCGVSRGPAEDELARAFVAAEAFAAAPWLAGLDDDELDVLWEEMLELPARDLSLHFPLPTLVTPELQRLIETIRDEDSDEADEALEDALGALDTPAARAVLARGMIGLRDTGLLDPQLAAVAILDLAGRSRALVRASLVEAAAVAAGAIRTPGGLVVVSELAA